MAARTKMVTDGDTCQGSEGISRVLHQGSSQPPHLATPPPPPPPEQNERHQAYLAGRGG